MCPMYKASLTDVFQHSKGRNNIAPFWEMENKTTKIINIWLYVCVSQLMKS
jgi:hypothetical protein